MKSRGKEKYRQRRKRPGEKEMSQKPCFSSGDKNDPDREEDVNSASIEGDDDDKSSSSFRSSNLPSFPSITSLRRDAVLGAFSLMELKELPVNLNRLLLPVLACAAHVAMLLLWRSRWRFSDEDPLPFSRRIWVSTPIIFSVLYVSLSYLGIRVMHMRTLLDEGVREAMLVYNVYQTIFHAYLAISIMRKASMANMALLGNPISEGTHKYPVVLRIWMLYYNQYVDLLDTAFIVVRKKTSQMTFLHLFKRVLLMWCWFLVLKCGCASGDAYFGAAMISVAQVLTYFYYTLGLLGVKRHEGWRPRVTELHLLSFTVLMMHAVYSLWWGLQPAGMSVAQFAVMGTLVVLFTDFHHEEIKEGLKRLKSGPRRRKRLVFSFDSSGWFYVYHFGVAKYLEKHVLPRLDPDQAAFSGASGGALVGATLAAGINVEKIARHVMSCQPECEYNPWKMLPKAEEAMKIFRRPGVEKDLCGRLSVLVTRVQTKPPFFKGEAVSEFKTCDDAFDMLRASCHVPLLGGVLPYQARGSYYYDGFFWPSFFVPWRRFHEGDKVVKTSAIGTLGAQIKPRIPLPLWWMVFPPNQNILEGMLECGYEDAAQYASFLCYCYCCYCYCYS
mmetsp:Transcript_11178/g.15588  ORF Transcript_11178/g.15588 Transcript_11178/m.15588 type:complete len:612 (-) Transcript_11178:35-1870(-)